MTDQTSTPGNSALSLLLSRASTSRFGEKGPNRAEVEQILQAAVTAPDHGRVRPWRFVVMEGEGRKRLGALMAEAFKVSKPEATEDELERERAKVLRAPVIIALIAQPDPAHKVPVMEQVLAAGAAGAHLMLAANALGYGAAWKTGDAAYHPIVREGLGFGEGAAIVGFFYVGLDLKAGPVLPRARAHEVSQFWT